MAAKRPKPVKKKAGARSRSAGRSAPKRKPKKAVAGLEIALLGGATVRVEQTAVLPQIAMQWSYRTRNRVRWTNNERAVKELERVAQKDLDRLGVDLSKLKQIAESEVAEIRIPYESEALGWEARVMPWEALLSAATRRFRTRSLRVIRHLRSTPPRDAARPLGDSTQALVVVSAPGRLADSYSFESERDLIAAALRKRKTNKVEVLDTPTPQQLRSKASSLTPHILHFSGIDAHQGAELLGEKPWKDRRDGVYLAGSELFVRSEEFARLVNAATTSPSLVTCNTYYSATRTAAQIVAQGAGAAIGLQDVIDDATAETFFVQLYKELSERPGQLLAAFTAALDGAVRGNKPMNRGSGFVLWSAVSLLASAGARATRARTARPPQTPQAPIQVRSGQDLRDHLQIEVDPLDQINYSLLHNGNNLFKRFQLKKRTLEGVIRNVGVEVSLQLGSQAATFREILEVQDQPVRLEDRIRLPLTWDYLRDLNESVNTVLYTRVSHRTEDAHDHVGYERTHPVMVHPVDMWRDEPLAWRWLPSFVLPRDPAVSKVVDRAQHYLLALADDPAAGFDGYQSVNPRKPDTLEVVDLQVQALWSALIYDFGLSYINPPPTYAGSSQRLRSPREVIESGRGTCIDLALLLAACIEFVGIYPALVLLKGHAFPAYWRSEKHYLDFIVASGADESTEAERQKCSWVLEADKFSEIVRHVKEENLVPLEAVALTERKGFWETKDEGRENCSSRREFDALIDITAARENNVTPVPLEVRR